MSASLERMTKAELVARVRTLNRSNTRLRRSAETAAASEERFRLLAEGARDMIYRMSLPDGRYEYVSPASKDVFGLPPRVFYEESVLVRSIIHPDFHEYFADNWQALLNGECPPTYNYRIVKPDGSEAWIHQRNNLVLGQNGQPVAIEGVVSDVTALRQSEQQLKQQHARQAAAEERTFTDAAVEAIPGVFYVINPESRFLRWNSRFLEVTGYTAEEFGRISPLDLFGDAQKELVGQRIAEAFEKGESSVEVDLITADRSTRPYFFTGSQAELEGQTCLVGMGMDVTESRQLSQDMERIFQMSTDMICTAGIDDSAFLTVSPSFTSVLGYPREELVGRKFFDFIVPEDIEPTQRVVEEQLKQGKTVFYFRNRYRCKDGSHKWLEWVSSPDVQRGVTFAVARDVTERVEAERALQALNDDLVRSNQELEQFAYVASHDLQEPLRMVSSYTQLLERRYKDKLDDDARDFINFAVDGAVRMQRLINDLLEYSRVQTRGKPFEPVDMHSVLGRVVSELSAGISSAQALVTNEDLPAVRADEGQITRLLQNLIGNAIKFHGEEPPRVHVSARRGDSEWVFSIRDNGIGIDDKYAERVFVIFQRLHGRDEHSGTGIGLAVCKRIVERHGGRIWFESEPGDGATFFFTLPDRAPQPDEA